MPTGSKPSRVDQAEKFAGLAEGGGHAPAERRRRRTHRVADEQQTRQHQVAVRPGLGSVVVEEVSAGQHGGQRVGPVWVGPGRQTGNGFAGGVEGRLLPQLVQFPVGRGADDDHREDAAIMQEREDPIAVVVGLPRHRVGQRTGFRAVSQLVHAVDVGDPAGAADPAPLAERPGDPAGSSGRVDHHVVRQRRPVHDQAPGAAVVDRHRIDMAHPQVEARLSEGRLPQRPLEDQPPGPGSHLHVAGGRMVHVDRLGARRQPALVRLRHLGLQSVGDLRTEAVRVMELHDALAGPRPIAGRARVALDQVSRGDRAARGQCRGRGRWGRRR